MYWVEEPNSASVSKLSNTQILDNINYAKLQFEYLYRRELCKLERIKSTAIIRNLEEFKSVQKKYFEIKSTQPKTWLENWDVFKVMIKEAYTRNLISNIQMNSPEKIPSG